MKIFNKRRTDITIIDMRGFKIKPTKYPKSTPTKVGKYLCHNKQNDIWFINQWVGYEIFSWRHFVDYYLPYELEIGEKI